MVLIARRRERVLGWREVVRAWRVDGLGMWNVEVVNMREWDSA